MSFREGALRVAQALLDRTSASAGWLLIAILAAGAITFFLAETVDSAVCGDPDSRDGRECGDRVLLGFWGLEGTLLLAAIVLLPVWTSGRSHRRRARRWEARFATRLVQLDGFIHASDETEAEKSLDLRQRVRSMVEGQPEGETGRTAAGLLLGLGMTFALLFVGVTVTGTVLLDVCQIDEEGDRPCHAWAVTLTSVGPIGVLGAVALAIVGFTLGVRAAHATAEYLRRIESDWEGLLLAGRSRGKPRRGPAASKRGRSPTL